MKTIKTINGSEERKRSSVGDRERQKSFKSQNNLRIRETRVPSTHDFGK